MSALILRSAKHLYKLLKVYLTLALLGALAVIAVETVLAKPVLLIAAFMIVSSTSIVVLLWAQSQGTIPRKLTQPRLQEERPPKLPESLMVVSLPAELAEEIIGDLTEEFYRLRSKYGRYSAITWYTIESASVFIKATALHCGLGSGKSLTQFLKKQSS